MKSSQWHDDTHWLCSHGLESRSERRFGSRSKTWFGSWFELRAFTCIVNAFPIMIRICALRGNIFSYCAVRRALIDPYAYAWLQRPFFCVSKRVSKAWFETALRSHGLKQAFKSGMGRITFWNVFRNVILAHVNTAIKHWISNALTLDARFLTNSIMEFLKTVPAVGGLLVVWDQQRKM